MGVNVEFWLPGEPGRPVVKLHWWGLPALATHWRFTALFGKGVLLCMSQARELSISSTVSFLRCEERRTGEKGLVSNILISLFSEI